MDVYFTWPWVPSIGSFPSAARRCLTIHDNVTGPDSIAASAQQCTGADAYDAAATVNVYSGSKHSLLSRPLCLVARSLLFCFRCNRLGDRPRVTKVSPQIMVLVAKSSEL